MEDHDVVGLRGPYPVIADPVVPRDGATGFAGRDSNGPPAGRIWLNCAACGMTQYSLTDLSNIGLGGNWMIRVTVEDQNCVPVELMGFDVEK